MPLIGYTKTIISFAAAALVSRTIYGYIQWRKKQQRKRRVISEVIVFSDSTPLVQSEYSPVRGLVPSSLDRVLFYLNQARYSLDICMYILTNKDISYLIQKLHFRGVKIRFIIDADMAYTSGAETKRLEKQNVINLSWMKSDDIMHHKFCLIDCTLSSSDVYENDRKFVPFVMTGSLNWTNPATSGNWESVVVMSEHKIVKWYKYEFEKLWLQFKNRDLCL